VLPPPVTFPGGKSGEGRVDTAGAARGGRWQAARAVLVVAHRLSTVLHADHAVMLGNGTLVDTATHPELMARCAPYRELVTTQAAASAG
jgi:ABC-type multidrug transport system fused ATPase/permease subunit